MRVKLLNKLRRKVNEEVALLSPGEFRERRIEGVLQQTQFDLIYFTLLSRYKMPRKFISKEEAIKAYEKEKRERFEILFSIEKRKLLNQCLPR